MHDLTETMRYGVDDVTKWLSMTNEEFEAIKVVTQTETEVKQHMKLIRAIKYTDKALVYVLFHDSSTNPLVPSAMPLYFPEKTCKLRQASVNNVQQAIAKLFATTVNLILKKHTVIIECSPNNKGLFNYIKSLRNSIVTPHLVVVFRYAEFFLAFKEPISGSQWVEWHRTVLDKKVKSDNSHKKVKFRPLCFKDRKSAIDTLLYNEEFMHTIDLYEPVKNYHSNNQNKVMLLSQRCTLENLLYTMPCKDIIWKCKQEHSIKPNHVLVYGGYPYLGPDGYKWMLEQLELTDSKYAFLFHPLPISLADIRTTVDTNDFKRNRFQIDQEITKTPYRQLQVFVDVTDKQSPWSLSGAIIYNYMASDLATLLSPSNISTYFTGVERDRFFIYAQAFMPMMRVRIIKENIPFTLVQQDQQNGQYWVLPIVCNIWCPDQYILIRAKRDGNFLVPFFISEYKSCFLYNYMLDECNR